MKPQVRTLMFRRRLWPVLAVALFCAPLLHAQHSAVSRSIIFTKSERAIKADAGIMAAHRSVALDVDMARFNTVAGPELHIAAMPLATGVSVDLDLQEYNIIKQGAQLSYTDANGVHPLPPLTAKLYRGTVSGDRSSHAYLAFSKGGVMGIVTINGKGYEIATDNSVPASNNRIAAVSAPSVELTGNSVQCGVDDRAKGPIDFMSKDELDRLMRSGLQSAESTIDYSVIGAYDADYEYLQLFNGDKQAAADYMLSTIGEVSAVYERDLRTQIVIGYMNLWDTSNDPYVESGVIQLALDEARGWWTANRDTVDRAFTNVFSGKPWTGAIGVAFLGGLCYKNPAIGYCGLTRTNPTRDTRVAAHETGHIFGSKHTHDCSWPGGAIDHCAAAEGGNCFSGTQQSLGTIMSYCSQAEFKFHSVVANFIVGKLVSGVDLPCLVLSRALSVKKYLIVFPGVDAGTKVDTTLKDFFFNNSKEPVDVQAQTLVGNNVEKFTVLTEFPFTLQPGESKDLSISYLSETDDASQATMTVTHTGLNRPVKVTLEAYSLSTKPFLVLAAPPKGEVNWNKRRIGKQIDTLVPDIYRNDGNGLLHVTKTEIVGPDRFEFQLLEGAGPFDLEKKVRASAKLRFAPTSTGPKLAWLRVSHNADTKVDSIALKGEGDTGPVLQLKANDLVVDFQNRSRGVSYDTTFTEFFRNGGSDTLTISFYIVGENQDLFSSNTSGFLELLPGQAVDFHAAFFAPAGEPDGQKQAQLVINPIYQLEVYDTVTVNLLANLGTPASVNWTSQKDAGISVVPNPTAGDADVRIIPMPDEVGARYTLRLTDAVGRELDKRNGLFTGNGVVYRVDGKNLAAGAYYLSVTTERGTRVATVTLTR